MDLFYLPAQVVRMPVPNQLDQNPSLLIIGIDQDKIRYHHRVSKQEDLAFACETPMSSFASHLLLKLARKILLEAAIEEAGAFEVGAQRTRMIKPVDRFSLCLRWTDVCVHLPTFTQQ